MAGEMSGKKNRSAGRGRLWYGVNSLRTQVSLIVLLSYLVPVALLGVFTGSILLNRLEEKTRAAVTSSAEHAFAMTEQNISRAVDLARDATYDGELTAAWEKRSSGEAGDAEFLGLALDEPAERAGDVHPGRAAVGRNVDDAVRGVGAAAAHSERDGRHRVAVGVVPGDRRCANRRHG